MHPYKNLPPKSFWRTAVSEKNFLDLENVYTKKFTISQTDRIVTAGSCFAQHIARKLSTSGFSYQDYEKAPPGFPAHLQSNFGYGMFSARYGNIYTARQLLQLFERAFDGRVPAEDIWKQNGRFFDPYRPAIEPDGFASEEEYWASRRTHFAAVRKVFAESETFVFTLGLTEAWRSRIDGSVFPVCPGTSCGTFDADRYEFHNFSFSEVIEDLRMLIDKARAVNAGLRFLFTVSPVPLTATASTDHVMVATSYSKSLLRTVVGEICRQDDLADYFPSYELVAAPPIRASLFEPNLRAVSSRGVDTVMRHFFEQHLPALPKDKDRVTRWQAWVNRRHNLKKHADDVVCEDAMLEQFAV